MSDIIYPRSPRETLCGWTHLPRYIDKIRLHLAGKLHPDYHENLGKGFDGAWLKAAGLHGCPDIYRVSGVPPVRVDGFGLGDSLTG